MILCACAAVYAVISCFGTRQFFYFSEKLPCTQLQKFRTRQFGSRHFSACANDCRVPSFQSFVQGYRVRRYGVFWSFQQKCWYSRAACVNPARDFGKLYFLDWFLLKFYRGIRISLVEFNSSKKNGCFRTIFAKKRLNFQI